MVDSLKRKTPSEEGENEQQFAGEIYPPLNCHSSINTWERNRPKHGDQGIGKKFNINFSFRLVKPYFHPKW